MSDTTSKNQRFSFLLKKYLNNAIKIDQEKDKEPLPKQSTLMQQVKNYFNPKSEKIKISYFQYYIRCCSNEISKIYSKLLNKGLNRIDQVMDISYIMNKLTEIDVLKVLLLDETQRDLFEYIPKPFIALDEDENSKKMNSLHDKLTKNFKRRNSQKANLAFKAFFVLSEKEPKTQLDEKMIEMVPKLNKIHNKSPKNLKSFKDSMTPLPHDIFAINNENLITSYQSQHLKQIYPK